MNDQEDLLDPAIPALNTSKKEQEALEMDDTPFNEVIKPPILLEKRTLLYENPGANRRI